MGTIGGWLETMYSTLANKWAFEQMVFFLAKNRLLTFREKMGIRENGNFDGRIAKRLRKWEDFEKKLLKQQSFRDQNA